MADPRINITIATQGQPQGAAQVTAALNETAAAGHRAGAAVNPPSGNPWVTASRNLEQLQNQAKNAAPAVDEVGKAATKAAGGNNKAQGLLLLGQAIEDAQYGLRGVMNNIPGLVMSFGLGAGAAGILQIGLVAVSQVLSLLDSQQKKVKDGAIDWSKLTPEEEVEEKMRKVTERLNEQAEALERVATARNRALEAEKSWLAHQERMAELEGKKDDPKNISVQFERREKSRANEVKAAEATAAGLQEQAKAANDEAARQQDKVNRLEEMPKLLADEAKLTKNIQDQRKALERAGDDLPQETREGVERYIQEEQAKLMDVRRRRRELPELTADGLTGDPVKDRDKLAQAFQREKDQAENLRRAAQDADQKAEDARANLETVRRETSQAGEEDVKDTTQRLEKITGLSPLPDPRTGRSPLLDPNLRPLLDKAPEVVDESAEQKRIDEEIAAEKAAEQQRAAEREQAQASGNAAVTEIVGGLDQAIQLAQTDQAKQRLAELRALLTDSDGATAKDVEMVLQAVRQVNASSGEAQRAVAGTMTAFAQAQQAFAAEVTNLRAQVEQLRTSVNSMR